MPKKEPEERLLKPGDRIFYGTPMRIYDNASSFKWNTEDQRVSLGMVITIIEVYGEVWVQLN